MTAATARVTSPTWLVSASWPGLRSRRWIELLGGVVEPLGDRRSGGGPTSVTSPTPCWAIAARTSGASAIRSTSIWALGLARISSHTRSATSLSSASTTACATSSLVSASSSALCDRVLLDDHPHDRPFHGGAAKRADDRLLGGVLDRLVDPGGARQALGAARAGAQQAGGGRARPVAALGLHLAAAVRAHRRRL